MTEKERELKGIGIEVHTSEKTGKITKMVFTPEGKANPWYRKSLDRNRDGVLCIEIRKDMSQLVHNLSKLNDKGQRVGKYKEASVINFPANPKSGQGSGGTEYKERLIAHIKSEKYEKQLAVFKNEEKLVYVCVYLREKRFQQGNDVDNFLKPVLDALKVFIGDDTKNVLVIAEKKRLPNYPEADMDFLEQIVIVVTEPAARADILKTA